jgi:hypothetical protein
MELQEPESPDAQVDDEGVVTGTVRIVRTCVDCGQELKEATLDFEIDVSGELRDHRDAQGDDVCPSVKDGHEPSIELSSCDASAYEDVQKTDRKGKTITNPRYQKTLFGAEVVAVVACSCGQTFEGADTVTVAASAMDELS